ncbi:hypothetical protein BDZ91DRAFT_767400 [Kalaharituber pfeilii]|nr:hypothetical protein BDZ91DRAFT_767400 [Kalaharituber pfeilii]
MVTAVNEEEDIFGWKERGFPVKRRPQEFRREVDSSNQEIIEEWFEKCEVKIGSHLMPEEARYAKRILYTWRDLFVTSQSEMPKTDLVIHSIPTYWGAKPHRAKSRIWTEEEAKWQQENIPKLEKAGVIMRCESPWSAKTTLVKKKEDPLRVSGEGVPAMRMHSPVPWVSIVILEWGKD